MYGALKGQANFYLELIFTAESTEDTSTFSAVKYKQVNCYALNSYFWILSYPGFFV